MLELFATISIVWHFRSTSLLDKVSFNSHLSSLLKVCISDRGTARGCCQFQDSLFKSLPEECRNWKGDVLAFQTWKSVGRISGCGNGPIFCVYKLKFNRALQPLLPTSLSW
ncbi:hypothetical protein ACFX13_029263 [Malus domestica]